MTNTPNSGLSHAAINTATNIAKSADTKAPNMIRRLLDKLPKLPPLPTQPPLHEPHRITLLQLGVLIGIAIVMHFRIASPVVAGFALIVFLLKMATIARGKTAPPKLVMVLLTVFSLGLILFFYGGWNGQTAGISFLVLLVALKFLESRNLRDYYVVSLILYFLSASTFLFDSSMFSIVSVLIFTTAITAVLFKISNPRDMHWPMSVRASLGILVRAIPLALILFFFFPRIGGDFGFLPSQDEADRASSLNNSLVMGELAASSFDTSLAFRAEFEGDIPRQQDLYWRSKVMPTERDFSWEVIDPIQRNKENSTRKQAAANLELGDVRYSILHEKSLDFFIPFLDYVSGYSKGRVLDDYSVAIKRVDAASFSYSGSSSFTPKLPKLNVPQAGYLTSTQSQPSARMQSVLNQLRQSANASTQLPADRSRALVDELYRYFVANDFSYSLSPPALDENRALDDFLFNTRIGYCEHFASAFTTMVRWLGVPARVVVGYQGGNINRAGRYVEVRYSDAHAWSEVWLDNQWQRVDPTASVAPERIEFGMEALAQLWDGNSISSNAGGRALASFLNPSGSKRLLREIGQRWKNLGYQWNKWVVNYDMQTQRELLSNLGFSESNSVRTLVALMGMGALGIMLFYFWRLVPKVNKLLPAQRVYLSFVKKFHMRRLGVDSLTKHPADSPREFAQRAVEAFPRDADQIQSITERYEALRYGPPDGDETEQLKLFQSQVKRFKLSPSGE